MPSLHQLDGNNRILREFTRCQVDSICNVCLSPIPRTAKFLMSDLYLYLRQVEEYD
jgi:hypothetical protein